MTELPEGHRVDWWAVVMQLNRAGLGLLAISRETGIPVSTLAGYKNLNVEPKHRDAHSLLTMWEKEIKGNAWPLQVGSVRNGMRASGFAFRETVNQLKLSFD
jgi:hypothetical protein